MGTSILLLFCVGLSITAGWMVFAWVIARLLNNLSIVDAAWAMAFLPTSFFLVLFDSDPTFSSYLLTVLMVCWSLRLSVHISFRIFKHHPQEDPRYRPLRQMFSKNEWLIYLVFFQLQGFVVALLLLPLIVTIVCGPRELSLFQFLATTLAFLSIGGEWLADWQLSNFKSKSNEPKAICKNGLWAWSRHPNYFF
ncbi:MAG: DUF1295 domain-containing protein, partial [Chthoniobacterales bacterium]|nr:DUF1295 domain-containing protein [Chthoniobacterales bacterium]